MGRVTAALIQHDERILIAQRGRDKRFARQWEFPGGKVRPDESPEDCLRREIKEELNLEIRVDQYCCTIHHRYPDFDIELITFWCSIMAGELRLAEHEQVRWITLPEASQYDFVEADLKVIAAIVPSPGEEKPGCHG
jgi:8-oxo-dGTP diphosphatase